MKAMSSRKIEPKGKESQIGNAQQGKNKDSIRPLGAGSLVRKVLIFHDSSIESRTPTELSLAQHRKSPSTIGSARFQFPVRLMP